MLDKALTKINLLDPRRIDVKADHLETRLAGGQSQRDSHISETDDSDRIFTRIYAL